MNTTDMKRYLDDLDTNVIYFYKKSYEINRETAEDAFSRIPFHNIDKNDYYDCMFNNGYVIFAKAACLYLDHDEAAENEYEDTDGLSYIVLCDENIYKVELIKHQIEINPVYLDERARTAFLHFYDEISKVLNDLDYELGDYCTVEKGEVDKDGIVKSYFIKMHSDYHPDSVPGNVYNFIKFTDLLKKALESVGGELPNEAK